MSYNCGASMALHDHSLAFALCASLIAHAAALDCAVELGGLSSFASLGVLPESPHTAPDDSLIFGLQNGTGHAANASEGDLPAIGPKNDQAQAFLSRDPVGASRVDDDSSTSVRPRLARDSAPPPQALASPLLAFGPSQTDDDVIASPKPFHRQSTPPAPAHLSAAPASVASSHRPAADPAPMSDSESDLFTPNTQIDFRTGQVDARLGRKVTTVRPQLSLADQYDLMAMLSPHIHVRLHINPDGSIRKVDIIESSGSSNVDEAVRIALYQWTFEPARPGDPLSNKDTVDFTIRWS